MQTFHRLTLKIIYMYTNGQNPLMYHYLKPTAVTLWVWGKYNVHAANYDLLKPPPQKKKEKKRIYQGRKVNMIVFSPITGSIK